MTSWKWYPDEEVASWPEGHKKCRGCQEVLPLSAFHKQKQTLMGVNNYCKECRKPKSKAQYAAYDHRKNLWSNARTRAKKNGWLFDITPEDIIIPDNCPILGIPLIRGKERMTPNSPVLDKIVPMFGYVKNNIQVISNKANLIKSNATPREIMLVAKYMVENHPEEHWELDSLTEPTIRWVK